MQILILRAIGSTDLIAILDDIFYLETPIKLNQLSDKVEQNVRKMCETGLLNKSLQGAFKKIHYQ